MDINKSNMNDQELTYTKAVEEIESILGKIENQELDVDDLGTRLKRVSELIRICKKKLHQAEKEVEKILKEME